MTIKQLTVGRLVSTGEYSNMRVEATAELSPDDDAVACSEQLIAFVDDRLEAATAAKQKLRDTSYALREVEYRHAQLTSEAERLQDKVRRMREFLGAHGVEVDELPF